MPFRKPGKLAPLSMGGTIDTAKTFDLSDTGTFASEGFRIGSQGIVDTPLHHGSISALRLSDLDMRAVLGRGASSRVHAALHRPTQKALAIQATLENIERNAKPVKRMTWKDAVLASDSELVIARLKAREAQLEMV